MRHLITATLTAIARLGIAVPRAGAETAKDLVGTSTLESDAIEGGTWPTWDGTDQKRTITSFTGMMMNRREPPFHPSADEVNFVGSV